jgi:small GTP-binding protein
MEVNIALVGVSGVGKTALVSQLCHETFFISPYPTIEDRHQKEFNIRGQTFKVTILDTGGDPKNNFLHTKVNENLTFVMLIYFSGINGQTHLYLYIR